MTIVVSIVMTSCGHEMNPLTDEDIHSTILEGRGSSATIDESSDRAWLIAKYREAIVQIKTKPEASDQVTLVAFDTGKMPNIETDLADSCAGLGVDTGLLPAEFSQELHLSKDIYLTETLRFISLERRIGDSPVRSSFFDCYYAKTGDSWVLHSIENQTDFDHSIVDLPLLSDEEVAILLGPDRKVSKTERVFLKIDNELIATSRVEYRDQTGEYVIFLDNDSGEPRLGFSAHIHGRSRLAASVYQRNYFDTNQYMSFLPLTEITFESGSETSSLDGTFSKGKTAKFVELRSPRVTVFDGFSEEPVRIKRFTQSVDLIQIEEVGSTRLALNAYAAVHRINKFAREFLSPLEVPFLDRNIKMRVNVEGSCNAYYTTTKAVISLFEEGNGCANIASVNDVIYHEWGHGLDDHTGRKKGVMDAAFSEGIGDFVAAFYHDDPSIGVGFVSGDRNGIRDISNKKTYPSDMGQPHEEGGIIAGAFWEMYQRLKTRYGVKEGRSKTGELFFRHLLITDSYLESYDSVLLVDDDDNNPATPSPNFCLINRAFAVHGLATREFCEDDEIIEIPSDTTLRLALYDISEGNVSLAASAPYYADMYICLGHKQSCLAGYRVKHKLDALSENEDRFFHALRWPLNRSRVDSITVMSFTPGTEELIGSRTFKVVSK